MTRDGQGVQGRRIGLAVVAACLIAATMGAGGCRSKQLKADLAAAQKENQDLRTQNEDLNRQIAEAQAASQRAQTSGGSAGDQVITIAGDVLFGAGSATIRPSARQELDKVVNMINSQYSSNRIEIAGHTDSDPLVKTKDKWGTNENLSMQRALAVQQYFASKGISDSRMRSSGYGSSKPKGSKPASRRVEVIILAN